MRCTLQYAVYVKCAVYQYKGCECTWSVLQTWNVMFTWGVFLGCKVWLGCAMCLGCTASPECTATLRFVLCIPVPGVSCVRKIIKLFCYFAKFRVISFISWSGNFLLVIFISYLWNLEQNFQILPQVTKLSQNRTKIHRNW